MMATTSPPPGGWPSADAIAAIVDRQSGATSDGPAGGEILHRDQPAVRGHVVGDGPGDLAGIEILDPLLGDPAVGRGHVGVASGACPTGYGVLPSGV